MIIYVTDFRKELFKIFKMVDEGEDVTIIKKDTNKRYKIVPVKTPKKDIVKIAQQMGKIGLGLGSLSAKEIKKIIETKYE